MCIAWLPCTANGKCVAQPGSTLVAWSRSIRYGPAQFAMEPLNSQSFGRAQKLAKEIKALTRSPPHLVKLEVDAGVGTRGWGCAALAKDAPEKTLAAPFPVSPKRERKNLCSFKARAPRV